MPTHILVNSLGLTHKGTIGMSAATIPDVCKTPSPGGPVPIPYPNFADQSSLQNGTTTVSAKGEMIAIKGSQYGRSNGDEAGTAGGVKSNVNMKATDWITYSFDVKMDGQNACRHTDLKFHNNQNTVDLNGNVDPQTLAKFEKVLCKFQKDCTDAHDKGTPPLEDWCQSPGSEPGTTKGMERGTAIDECVTKKINETKARSTTAFSKEVKAQERVSVPVFGGKCRPDVIVGTPPNCDAVYDIKTTCPDNKPPPSWPVYGDGTRRTRFASNKLWHGKSQGDIYRKACGVKPKIIHRNSTACRS